MPSPTPSRPITRRGLFVTGTDTRVGKTLVTAALGLALQRVGLDIGVMKPVETGIAPLPTDHPQDGTLLHHLLTPKENKELIMPYQFKQALAPLDAARHENSAVHFEVIIEAFHTLAARHEYMLVEGVGGVMVPLSDQGDVRDLILLLQLPCVLISRISLGAVNHTRLTWAALRDYGIPVLAIVLNETTLPTNPPKDTILHESTSKLIREFCPVPVFGPLPYQNNLGLNWVAGVTALSQHSAFRDLATMVWPRS